MATVQTVTGPIDSAALGETLIHEHLVARDEAVLFQFPQLGTLGTSPLEPVSTTGAEGVADRAAAEAKSLGVGTICDPSAMYLGRDVALMKRVSERTGLQVVPCTGIYTYDHLPTGLVGRDADRIAELYVHDIETGIQGTEIKAAFIKCAADEPGITENVEKLHRAAARASVQTGVPIMAHSRPASDTAPRQIEIMLEEGVSPEKIQIAHCGDSPDPDYVESILATGVYAGLDRFGIEMYLPFDQRIEVAKALLARGHAERLFLSADSCATIDWFEATAAKQLADAGMIRDWTVRIVHDRVLPDLREAGMSPEQERTMMVANAARWLTGDAS